MAHRAKDGFIPRATPHMKSWLLWLSTTCTMEAIKTPWKPTSESLICCTPGSFGRSWLNPQGTVVFLNAGRELKHTLKQSLKGWLYRHIYIPTWSNQWKLLVMLGGGVVFRARRGSKSTSHSAEELSQSLRMHQSASALPVRTVLAFPIPSVSKRHICLLPCSLGILQLVVCGVMSSLIVSWEGKMWALCSLSVLSTVILATNHVNEVRQSFF